jgi:hypothetical protein
VPERACAAVAMRSIQFHNARTRPGRERGTLKF